MFPFSHSKLYTTALLHMKQASEKEERFNIFLPEVPAHPGGGLSPYRPTPPHTRHEQLFHRHRPALKTICILLAATCLGRDGLDRRKVIGRQVPAEETTLGIAGVGGGNGGYTPERFPEESTPHSRRVYTAPGMRNVYILYKVIFSLNKYCISVI